MTALRGRRVASGLLCAVALVNLVAVGFWAPRSGPLVTTYAAVSGFASAVGLAAAIALVAAGVLAWREPAAGALGPIALLASIVWLAPDWVGWEGGWPSGRSAGMLLAPLTAALMLHVVLAAPRGRLPGRGERVAIALTYSLVLGLSGARALVRDPFEDPQCWSNCSDNVFLIHADRELAEALGTTGLVLGVILGVAAVVIALLRLWRATRTGRRAVAPTLAPAALMAACESVYAVALLGTATEDPTRTGFAALFVARAAAAIALAAGIGWTAVRARRSRAAVARLGVEPSADRPLRKELADALGDPTLEVGYPLPGTGEVVDANGVAVAPREREPGRGMVRIERGGEPIAIVTHDAALLDGPALEREIGAAARLALHNERLQATVLARLEDVRASRARIVDRGDAERRRLERNLHDGAQQRLIALSYELRLAGAGATGERATVLATASEEAQAALRELRELAHGIYPAILTDAGLGPALETMADTAPLAVELGELVHERLPAAVEMAAYLVALAGVEDAAARGATTAGVRTVRRDEMLVIEVLDDGRDRVAGAQHIADRVGALGGRLVSGPHALEAAIPCG
jgi:signal transduction histidine kinase